MVHIFQTNTSHSSIFSIGTPTSILTIGLIGSITQALLHLRLPTFTSMLTNQMDTLARFTGVCLHLTAEYLRDLETALKRRCL